MRCRKARFSLESNKPISKELLEHLRNCPSCMELGRAQMLLNGAFESMRAERVSNPTPISTLKGKVAVRQNEKEISIMAEIINIVTGHKRWTFGITFGLLALKVFLAVPFHYQRTVGYSVSIAGLPADIPEESLQKALAAAGQGNVGVQVTASDAGFSYLIADLPDQESARAVKAVFMALSGGAADARITPIIETVSASLYAQARERIVKVEVDGEGKTDEQIKAEVESKLAAQGLSPAFVFVKTDPDGKRNIKLEIAESGDSTQGQQTTIEVDGRGKTDEQVAAEVRAKLAEQGRPNANVTVTSNGPDSLRQIRIEIEDTTGQ